MIHKEEITNWFKKLQDDICFHLEQLDGGSTFKEDKWVRPEEEVADLERSKMALSSKKGRKLFGR